MFCPKCGTKIGDFDKFCNNCGWKNKLTYKSDGIDLSGAKKAAGAVIKAADVAKGVVAEKADNISKKVDEIGKNVSSKTKEINDKAITPFFDRAINFFKRRIDIFFSIAALVALRIATIVTYATSSWDDCGGYAKKIGDDSWAISGQSYALDYFINQCPDRILYIIIPIIIILLLFILFIVFNNIFTNIVKIVLAIISGFLFVGFTNVIINHYYDYNPVSLAVALGLATLFLIISAIIGIIERNKLKKKLKTN